MEVGHIFMLQCGYSEGPQRHLSRMNCRKRARFMWMGCYGIGTTRLMQAIVEQNRDEHGIIWPVAVAPYKVHIVPINWSNAMSSASWLSEIEAGLQQARPDDPPGRPRLPSAPAPSSRTLT